MEIIEQMSEERTIKLQDGEVIKLIVTDDFYIIVKSETKGFEIGNFDFNFIDDDNGGFYKLMNMHLEKTPGYLNRGIGTACVQYCIDYTGLPVVCGRADGMDASDGSHLTGDGEGFAMKMIEKGLIRGQI